MLKENRQSRLDPRIVCVLLKMAPTKLIKVKDDEALIDMLFDDVLLEVFSSLSGKDLKNAALVCRRWSEIIGGTAATMEKFKLVWSLKKFNMLPENFQSTRKHQTLNVTQINCEKIGNFINHFNISSVKRVILNGEGISCDEILPTILPHLPVLKRLGIRDFVMTPSFSPLAPAINFPDLERLFIAVGDARIFEQLQADNVGELTCDVVDPVTSSFGALANFIRRNKKLKKLNSSPKTTRRLFQANDISDAAFRMKSLSGFYTEMMIFNNEFVPWNLIKFLSSQASSIEILDLWQFGSQKLPLEIYTMLADKFSSLTHLQLNPNQLPSDLSFLVDLSPMTRLTTLLFFDQNKELEDDRPLKVFLRKCPNIELLNLSFASSSSDQLISLVARHNTRLTSLCVSQVWGRLEDDLKFHNLKEFSVIFVPLLDHWLRAIANSPKLEIVKLNGDETRFDINHLAIEALMTNAAIRKFRYTVETTVDRTKVILEKKYDLLPVLEDINKTLRAKFSNSFLIFGLPPTTDKSYDDPITALKRFFAAAGVTQDIEIIHFRVLRAVNNRNGTGSHILGSFRNKEILQNVLPQMEGKGKIPAEEILDLDMKSPYRGRLVGLSTQIAPHSYRLMEEFERKMLNN